MADRSLHVWGGEANATWLSASCVKLSNLFISGPTINLREVIRPGGQRRLDPRGREGTHQRDGLYYATKPFQTQQQQHQQQQQQEQEEQKQKQEQDEHQHDQNNNKNQHEQNSNNNKNKNKMNNKMNNSKKMNNNKMNNNTTRATTATTRR